MDDDDGYYVGVERFAPTLEYPSMSKPSSPGGLAGAYMTPFYFLAQST